MGNETIASVTIVYNGADVLPRQLRALKRQTRKLDEIVVVNNASSDETALLLKTDFPEVTVLNLQENVGVGGGFAAGLDYAAYQKKYSWIWLFDQDSLPAEDGLESLLKGLHQAGDSPDNIAILAPVCIHEQTKLRYSGSIWRHGLRKPPLRDRDQPVSFVDSVISSGTLLRRAAVEEAGLPRADFFMDFVDHEYCLRLRHHGYRIAVVGESRMEHAIGDPLKVNVFGYENAWASHAPWREYYMTRNEVFTVLKYDPDWRAKWVVGQRLFRHAAAVLLFGGQKLACLKMMCRGIADGCAGHLGIRSFDKAGFSSNRTA
jgi:rhamnopyranosyl-N-acetylglucosaminyl-diphospho-decaprenol beta-1,3/1,4-galactofuranosyltransferase